MEAFYFLGFIQAFRCLLAFQAALLSEGYSFLRPYPNFISYLYVSQPRVSQKPAIISTVQAPCFLFLIQRQEKLSWDIQLGNCLFMPLSSSSLLHLWLVNAAQGSAALWRPQGATDLGMRLNICNKSWKWERNFSWSTVSSNAMIRALKLNGSTSLWLIQDML